MRSRPSVSRPLAAVSLAATLVLFGGISAAVADAGADRHRANAGAAARHDARATTQPAPAAPTRVTRSLAELADIARANVLPGPTSDGFGRRSGFSPGGQHGGSTDHLPAVSENMELVGKVELTGRFGNVVPGQIADVAVYKDHAYLNSWIEETCTRGGVYIADISDPANPRETGFIPALPGNYHGEGAHVITVNTPSFRGDVLAVNNEFCVDEPTVGGGFSLYDVTDPSRPRVLAQGVGDRGPEGSLTGASPTANSSHSVFLWQDGARAFAVAVDNIEAHDVDIFEITDPRNPTPVREYDLVASFPNIVDRTALGSLILNHDMIVKEIGGVQTMLVSYWDAGYVALNVEDPANATYIADTSFDGADPLTDLVPPEGNAHQAEFSSDNRYFLAADEDFNPYRAGLFSILTGPNARAYPSAEVGGGVSPASLPDRRLNGPTIYGGYGCDESRPIPPRATSGLALNTGEEAIVVLQRGPAGDPNAPEAACFPGEKAANAAEAGYDAVLLVNRHLGDAATDSPFCGSGGYPPGLAFVTVCTTHTAFHAIFNRMPPIYSGGSLDREGEPRIGDRGERVEATAVFDGWGYAHLYEVGRGKLREVDAFAVEESLDPRYAFGFGDLSIHEFATDPSTNLAYSAYYAAGLRVFRFGPDGIEQTGKFIDEGGSNFWGIEQFTDRQGNRLMAGSDRDFGLYIVRYTGPGAALPPACQDSLQVVSAGVSTNLPLLCTDPNGNPITRSIVTGPRNGTLGPVNQAAGTVAYTPNAGFVGTDSFTFRATDGQGNSNVATVRLTVVPVLVPGRCANEFRGTGAAEAIVGTVFGDTIFGLGGEDDITGAAGDDCLFGGDALDKISGDEGDDLLRGNAGRDIVSGGPGRDALFGDDGDDKMTGGSGQDRLYGDSGRDKLSGDAGDDRLFGGPGNDSLAGGHGQNRLFGGGGNDIVNSANGKPETVSCGPGRDVARIDRRDRTRGCERIIVGRQRRR